MKEKTKYLVIAIAVLLVVGVGISFAYFMANVNQTGEGSSTTGTTVTLKDTVVKVDGNLTFNDLDIYPGHKNVSSIKVTATGDQTALYNLIWKGENTLNTSLKYYVYKTTSEGNPSISCEKKEEGTLTKKYYEECEESGFESLGNIVASGEIGTTEGEETFKLIKNEEIEGREEGNIVYYYVVLEYPNEEGSQNIDIGGHFNGTVHIELLEEKELTAAEVILANSKVNEGTPNFASTATTDEGVFKTQDDWGDSYYFRGAVNNNWVKFAGFYWRIIRINGDGSIRLIYNGTSTATTGNSTQIQTNTFSINSSTYNNNAYVGYMYTVGQVHGLGTNSGIKEVLDSWYSSNLASYADKISTEAGFCGDREPSTNSSTNNGQGGTGTTQTYYGEYIRLITNKNPDLKCSNSSDLYTTSSSSKGNKALTNPIGLITADEVSMAGGVYGSSNSSYYLYTGQGYWTMSSFCFYGSYAYVFRVSSNGSLNDTNVDNSLGVRPVINLAHDVEITGTGTSDDPYVVV